MNYELQNIISGIEQVKHGATLQTIISYLSRSQETSRLVEKSKHFKNQETKRLIDFTEYNKIWIAVDLDQYLSEGAKQKVYLKDEKWVWKLNDIIYYESWYDYFINLLLNNYFFPTTAYNLKGFFSNNAVLYAVVEQPFIKATEKTDLENVKIFMTNNGFVNTRNNDFIIQNQKSF